MSMTTGEIVVDQYSTLSHKALVGDATSSRFPATFNRTSPSWVPASERRRLAAYIVRAAYRSNVGRLLMPAGTPETVRSTYREYGDADLLVDRVVAGVLGNDWELVVDGANEDLPDEPDLPPEPDKAAADASPLIRRIADIRMQRWEADATATVDEWDAQWHALPALQARQEALREWADSVQLDARIDEAEHDAVALGDTVIVLWPRDGDWPRLAVYDPGFYFPVIDEDSAEDFPTRVHLAWEFDRMDRAGNIERMVRRITFDLVDITATRSATNDLSQEPEWLDVNGQPAAHPTLAGNEGVDPDGRIWRNYPWDPPDGKHFRTCLLTDGVWKLENVQAGEVDALDESKGEFTARGVDMGIPMLPLLHVPNTPAGKEHFGRSVLDVVAQILDDMAENDTDTMLAARYSAGPVLSLAGATSEDTKVRPGTVFNVGENGRMDVLDMSGGLVALMDRGDRLLDRMSTNSRVPAKMIGRMQGSQQASGIAIALEFAPFKTLVGVMRMSRAPKYSLLLTFAQRLAMLQGAIEPGEIPRARVEFGSYMPSDRDAAVTMVVAALNAHAISTQTAVTMLVAAGMPIEDAAAEVDRIKAEDSAAAVDVANATGSEELAAEWLGLELPEPVGGVPPVVALPPVPPIPPQPGTGPPTG